MNSKIKKDPIEIYKFDSDGKMYQADIKKEQEYISLLNDFNKQNELLQLIKDKVGYTQDKSLVEVINELKEIINDGKILISGKKYVSLGYNGEYVSELIEIKEVEEKDVTDKYPNLLNNCHKRLGKEFEEDEERLKAVISTL